MPEAVIDSLLAEDEGRHFPSVELYRTHAALTFDAALTDKFAATSE